MKFTIDYDVEEDSEGLTYPASFRAVSEDSRLVVTVTFAGHNGNRWQYNYSSQDTDTDPVPIRCDAALSLIDCLFYCAEFMGMSSDLSYGDLMEA